MIRHLRKRGRRLALLALVAMPLSACSFLQTATGLLTPRAATKTETLRGHFQAVGAQFKVAQADLAATYTTKRALATEAERKPLADLFLETKPLTNGIVDNLDRADLLLTKAERYRELMVGSPFKDSYDRPLQDTEAEAALYLGRAEIALDATLGLIGKLKAMAPQTGPPVAVLPPVVVAPLPLK